MRILKLLLALGSVAGATSITSAVGGNPNPLLTTGDIWAGTTNGAPTNLPAGASGTFLGSNGIGIAPTYQLINYSSLTGTVPTWNQSTTGSAATLTTSRTIATSGDVTGTATNFNGSANISIPTTVSGINGATVPLSKTIVGTNGTGQIVDASAATLANNTTGSAATLTTGRTISLSGAATGASAAFNGSAAATIPVTLTSTITAGGPTGGAATVPIITYNAAGQLTAVSTATITPSAIGAQTSLSGGATNALVKWTGAGSIGNSTLTDNTFVVSTSEQLQSTYAGTTTGPFGLVSKTTAPGVTLWHTGGATDAKIWGIWGDISGSLNFNAYNDAQNTLQSNTILTRTGNLTLPGALNAASEAISGNATVGGTFVSTGFGTVGTRLSIDAAAGVTRRLYFTTSGVMRWGMGANTTAESGSDAGSDFEISARFDGGTEIDKPMTIYRAAGGTMVIRRPIIDSSAGTAISAPLGDISTGTAYKLGSLGIWEPQPGFTTTYSGIYGGGVTPSSTNYALQFDKAGTEADINGSAASGLQVAGTTVAQAIASLLRVTGSFSVSNTATISGAGTSINAPNGDIATGGNFVLSNPTSISGAGVYTQPFSTSNAIQYYDGGGSFTLTAPSATGLAGKKFLICNRAASITGFPTGANAYYAAPGAAVSVGHCVEALSDGTKWLLLP